MLGAITGDIVGSRFEWNNIKSKKFELFTKKCEFTDDTVMTAAVADALMKTGADADNEAIKSQIVSSMKEIGVKYPRCGYGGRFIEWIFSYDTEPYNSWGNGSAMRVSPCGFMAKSLEEAERLAELSASVTHNHPEGIKGAKATAAAIYLAADGKGIDEIRRYICDNYYNIDFTLDEIRPGYEFDVSCQGSVPQALEAFFESNSFEDAIRNAISIGGDSDTVAAITGGIAEAYYGIPAEIKQKALTYLSEDLLAVVKEFYKKHSDSPT